MRKLLCHPFDGPYGLEWPPLRVLVFILSCAAIGYWAEKGEWAIASAWIGVNLYDLATYCTWRMGGGQADEEEDRDDPSDAWKRADD